MYHTVFVFLALASVCAARMAYQLASGYEEVLTSQLKTTFSCDDLPYGYYADVDNNCEVFHVCLPIPDEAGVIVETAQFSFVCGNQTLFSQESLTCAHPEDSFPCSEARGLYGSSNADFGKIPKQ